EIVSLQPSLKVGEQYGLSRLEYAALADIGWKVSLSDGSAPLPITPPIVPPPPPPLPIPDNLVPVESETPAARVTEADPIMPKCNCGACAGCVAITTGNTVQLFDLSNGAKPLGDVITPFPGVPGSIRAITADVTADGTPDLIAVTGAGGGSLVRVIDGLHGTDIVQRFSVFEAGYTGGLYVAAADVDGDGKADIIVSPDQGGGGRVSIFSLASGNPVRLANFFGIDDSNFRGGARLAAADLNADGRADLIVGAGFGGGPRVAIFDGASLTTTPRKLVNDFFAFTGTDAQSLRNGVTLAAGDLTGDGRADLVIGGGPGGGPRVMVLDGALTLSSPVFAVQQPVRNFFAFESVERGGVRVAIQDVNRDGRMDLIVSRAGAGMGRVQVYDGTDLTTAREVMPLGASGTADGIYVG
ncbi:MAG: FG-GAP repeat domain-containing protein, partial [Gemmataceae bacterium]